MDSIFTQMFLFFLFFFANTFVWIWKGLLELFSCSSEHTESGQLWCIEFLEACSSKLKLKKC